MREDYIDFISAYCDRWCERCAFTSRCSAYAVEIAMGMCEGDVAEAIELAVGAPPPQTAAEQRQREEFCELLGGVEAPTPQEVAQFGRELDAQAERVDAEPLSTAARRFSFLAAAWLDNHRDGVESGVDAALADALSVAGWDCHLIATKLHRALKGRDDWQRGEDFDDHPIQNDWNGSAKVALLSIARSLDAWRRIADATRDADARHVAEELEALGAEAEQAFPNARKFKRPGFDA